MGYYWGGTIFGIDVDGDDDIDVLSASDGDDTIAWYENADGSGGSWTTHTITTTCTGARAVFGIDMDGDGDVDVVASCMASGTVEWYENTDGSGGSWTTHTITTSADTVLEVFGIDVDGDGDVDVLSASQDDDTIAWYVSVHTRDCICDTLASTSTQFTSP